MKKFFADFLTALTLVREAKWAEDKEMAEAMKHDAIRAILNYGSGECAVNYRGVRTTFTNWFGATMALYEFVYQYTTKWRPTIKKIGLNEIEIALHQRYAMAESGKHWVVSEDEFLEVYVLCKGDVDIYMIAELWHYLCYGDYDVDNIDHIIKRNGIVTLIKEVYI
jgi:hypothetical protein